MNHHKSITTKSHKTQSIIAIDIAKDSLEVCTAQESFSQKNSQAGFAALLRKAKAWPNVLVVFEATGGYERPLVDFLHASKTALCIINPARLRAFAKSEGIKAKTDPLDARMIYRFADSKELRPTPARSHQQRALADLLDRRCQLSEFLAREKNRLQKCVNKTSLASLRRSIKSLEKELARMEKSIRDLVAKTPVLRQSTAIITSVVGVGEVTAWTLLGQLPEITRLNRNQLVALAGVAPYNNDSGKHSGLRYIHGGRAKIRRVLFMAATTATRFNPVIRPYVEGLIARGKPYKCALTAAMRKLLIHIHSLLKNSDNIPC